MVQGEHQEKDFLSIELTRPDKKVSKVSLTTYEVKSKL